MIRFLILLSLVFEGCVLKATNDEVMAKGLKCDADLQAVNKEREQLRSKLEESQKQVSDIEARNEELSQTNQLLAGRNSEFSKRSLDSQKELLRIKKEDEEKSDRDRKSQKETYEFLARTLKTEIGSGAISLSQSTERISIVIPEKSLFPANSDQFSATGKKILSKTATALEKLKDRKISVEFYLDDAPIPTKLKSRYPTAWELSTASASKIARWLEDNGMSASRLSATGYATPRQSGPPRGAELVLLRP